MQIQHLNVKLLVANVADEDLDPLIPVFHNWIENQNGEVLVDVADYRHVPDGPGIVLVGHEGNYSVDHTGGLWGIRYSRKTPLDGTNQDRLEQATRAALTACQRLESEPRLEGKLQFGGQELEISINDRLLAPNTQASRDAAAPEFRSLFRKLFGNTEYAIAWENDPRRLLTARVRMREQFSVAELLNACASQSQ